MSVRLSRRNFLKSSAGLPVFATTGSAGGRTQGKRACVPDSLPTPTAPDESLDGVVSEAYGELLLCPERRYWRWPIEASAPVTIDYEVRVPGDTSPPDVLVVDQEAWRTYERIVSDYPIIEGSLLDQCTFDLGPLGNREVPCSVNVSNLNFGNVAPKIESFADEQVWRDDSTGRPSPMFEIDTVDCLSNPTSRPIRMSETISGGQYYIVFDWTKDILSEPRSKRVSAEVAVRATRPLEESGGETEYEDELAGLYNSLPEEMNPLAREVRALAKSICRDVEAIPADMLQTAVPQASQISSVINILLTLIEDHLGYAPTFRSEVMATASSWTRLGMAALPVVRSANQLIEDACAVAEARPEAVTDEVENLLTSLGIFVADLLLVKFGAASSAARMVTRAAHEYLLGYLRHVLGRRAYFVLLRELYTLITSTIRQALEEIRDITRKVARKTDFVDDSDVEWVKERDEGYIQSLRPSFTMRSPECDL